MTYQKNPDCVFVLVNRLYIDTQTPLALNTHENEGENMVSVDFIRLFKDSHTHT